MFTTLPDVVKALHSGVLALVGASIAALQLKQESPFKTDYGTMVAFLVAFCVYIVAGIASIKFNGYAQEVTTSVSLLSGLLASLLIFLIIIPALGWVCLALWVLLVVTIAYKRLSSWHRKPVQQDNQSQDHVTIQMASPDGNETARLTMEEGNIDEQQQKRISLGSPATKWITVYNPHDSMKQRYHYDVKDSRLSQKIEKGREDGLFISSIASCSNLWALIMDECTGFSDQVYELCPNFLPDEWIKEQWDKDYYITAMAGADNGSSLVVMSKGTQFSQQSYKESNSFPFEWIENIWDKGYYITSMATSKSRWAIVMSLGAGFSQQAVEMDSKYPSERIHKKWANGYDITAIAAMVDQSAFVLSVPRAKPKKVKQETYRSYSFPEKHIKEFWEKDFYVTSICYGRTDS